MSYLEAKGLGFYTASSVVVCKPHPEVRGQPPRQFWVEQLPWAKSKSLGKGAAASHGSPTLRAAEWQEN